MPPAKCKFSIACWRNGRQPYLYLMSSVQPALNEASWLFRGQNARQRDLTPLLARFAPGAAFGFDLLAYPCKKVYEGHRNSVRTFLHTPQERLDWLERQGEKNGFSLSACHEDEAGDIRGKRKTGLVQFLRRALYRRFARYGCGQIPPRLRLRHWPRKGLWPGHVAAAKGVSHIPRDLNQLPKLRDSLSFL